MGKQFFEQNLTFVLEYLLRKTEKLAPRFTSYLRVWGLHVSLQPSIPQIKRPESQIFKDNEQ